MKLLAPKSAALGTVVDWLIVYNTPHHSTRQQSDACKQSTTKWTDSDVECFVRSPYLLLRNRKTLFVVCSSSFGIVGNGQMELLLPLMATSGQNCDAMLNIRGTHKPFPCILSKSSVCPAFSCVLIFKRHRVKVF